MTPSPCGRLAQPFSVCLLAAIATFLITWPPFSASAEIIGIEDFTYPDGPIAGQSGTAYFDWDSTAGTHSNTPASVWADLFGTPAIESNGLITDGSGVWRAYGNNATTGAIRGTGVVYYKVALTRSSTTAWSGLSSFDSQERIFFGVLNAGGPFIIRDYAGPTDKTTSIVPVADQTYVMVAKIDFDSDTLSLWIDPDLSQSEGSTTPNAVHAAFTDNSWSVRCRLASGGRARWDGLVVATTWEDLKSRDSWSPATHPLNSARSGHTATLLPNGKVLVSGGIGSSGDLNSAEIFDPSSNSWSNAGNLNIPRRGHTATLLPNGHVLVSGGSDSGGYLNSAEIFDPSSNSWSNAGNLNNARFSHTATLLPNGHVLVSGGSDSGGYLNSAEIFNPSSNSWSNAGNLNIPRRGHTATLLPNGHVLVSGGIGSSGDLNSAEIFNPSSNSWSNAGNLNNARFSHTATLLPNGHVLVSGGVNSSGGSLNSAEIFDPSSNSWSNAGNLNNARFSHTATLLPNGHVLVSGGFNSGSLNSAEIFNPSSNSWSNVGNLNIQRVSHTATLLPNGHVLVSGGSDSGVFLNSAEIFDPGSIAWFSNTDTLDNARRTHTATLLPNGHVLVSGGYNLSSGELNSAEIFDPSSGTWSNAGTLISARQSHTATLLPNGHVLVSGGYNLSSGELNSAEIFDPSSNSWSNADTLISARSRHTATLLPNGHVLVSGGFNSSGYLNSAEIFDPSSNSWSNADTLISARSRHTATLLPNGHVLVSGGIGSSGGDLNSAEIFDPSSNSWSNADTLISARFSHTATLLPNGHVLVSGGFNSSGGYLNSAEIFDPSSNSWSNAGNLISARYFHTASLLPNGHVLVSGGFNSGSLNSAEIFDPSSNSWSNAGKLISARFSHTATLLPNGHVLVSGGFNSGSLNSAEIFDESQGFSVAWQPQISSVTFDSSGGLVVNGTGLDGLSSASGGNGAQNSATNYPLVQIRRLDNEQSSFLTWDPDSTTISDSTVTSVPLLPRPEGHALVTVFVNGIPSDGYLLAAPDDVQNTNDSGPGSLRDAITNVSPGSTITFAPALDGQTITLGGTQLTISKNLTIDATALPNGITIDADGQSRVFEIAAGGHTVAMHGLTLTGGNATGESFPDNSGGGIYNSGGTLTLTHASLSGNSANFGGGIYNNNSGTLTLTHASLSGNSANNLGGGIYNSGGTLTLTHASLSGNSANNGGGIDNSSGGTLTLTHASLSGNSAANFGGGIYNNSGGTLTLTHASLSGNSANFGGGIYNNGGTLTLTHASLSGNSANNGGGGIRLFSGTLSLNNSLVAGNRAGTSGPDIAKRSGTITPTGVNLIGNHETVESDFPDGPLVGTPAAPLDPKLSPLGYYGGSTMTMHPLVGSPAIDPADGATTSTETIDQRGFTRLVGGILDIGAVEAGPTLEVDSADDSVTGSLRDRLADATTPGQRILFDPAVFSVATPPIITLTTGELGITNKTLFIDASNIPNGVTVSGNNTSRVFQTDADSTVAMDHLTITGGKASDGGGIKHQGQLTLSNSTVIENEAVNNGGGIRSLGPSAQLVMHGSTVSVNTVIGSAGGGLSIGAHLPGLPAQALIINSTISGNTVSGNTIFGGGGIFVYNGLLDLQGSTISGNLAMQTVGGGIHNSTNGKMLLTNATLANNEAQDAGGIHNEPSATLSLRSATVSANTATNRAGGVGNAGGSFTLENSVVADNTAPGGFPEIGGGHTPSGVNHITSGAMLSPLGDFGGPTQTMHPLTGSPLIDPTGSATSSFLASDQRGLTRVVNGKLDIGAVEAGDFVVNTLVDETDGFNTGDISLRDAIEALGAGGTITFAPALDGQTITLAGTQLTISKNLTIDATALPNGITIDADGQSRVFEIAAGGHTVAMHGLTLTGGNATGASFPDNSGGGIFNSGGTLTLTHASLSGNSANFGGGIYNNNSGTLTLTHTSLSGNSAAIFGGGIYNNSGGTLTLTHASLSGNSANFGGGIRLFSGTLNLNNTLVAGNRARISGPDIQKVGGTITPTGVNLIGNHETVESDFPDGPLVGTPAAPLDPKLSPLGYYGGSTMTMHPLAGSPAIDPADGATTSTETIDQRGFTRLVGGVLDIGAVEAGPTLEVDSADDSVTGSLRDRLAAATTPGQRILFDPAVFSVATPPTITLTSGELEIIGKTLFIDASNIPNGVTVSGNGSSRVFQMAPNSTVALDHLVVADGNASNSPNEDDGGGIKHWGQLTLSNSTITNNEAVRDGGGIQSLGSDAYLVMDSTTVFENTVTDRAGGGLSIGGGAHAMIRRSTISENRMTGASGFGGGGLFVFQSDLELLETEVSANTATRGGGIYNLGGNLSLNRSTLAENATFNNGGGIFNGNGGILALHQVTIANNKAFRGGGLYQIGPSTATLQQVTLSGNHASQNGGGIRLAAGSVNLENTLVASNTAITEGPDIAKDTSGDETLTPSGVNLLSDLSGSGLSASAMVLEEADPKLSPLGYFGGPTLTMHPLVDSPAINAAGSTDPGGTDQRGFGFSRFVGGLLDIGAVEAGPMILVDVIADEDGITGAGDTSLREAIRDAGPGGRITFDEAVFDGEPADAILLNPALNQIEPTQDGLFIDASNIPAHVVVHGSDQIRLFRITNGHAVAMHSLALVEGNTSGSPGDNGGAIDNANGKVTLMNGYLGHNTAAGSGGALGNAGEVRLFDTTVINNNADVDGGGLANFGGAVIQRCGFRLNASNRNGGGIINVFPNAKVSLSESALWENTAVAKGGGLFNAFGSAIIENTTMANNSAGTFAGAGIWNESGGQVHLRHATVAANYGNTVSGQGAGAGIVTLNPATLTLENSIVADNIAEARNGGANARHDLYGDITTFGANLVEVRTGNMSGVAPLTDDPKLSPLGGFGGSTPTKLLLSGSPAIDAGIDTANTPMTDQRLFARVVGAAPDLGAYEAGNAAGYGAWAVETIGVINGNQVPEPTVDFSGDGLVNLRVYGAGLLDPLAHNPDPESQSIVEDGGENYLALTFPRRTDAPDLIYEVRAADHPADLADGGTHDVVYRYANGEVTDTGFVVEDTGTTPPTLTVRDTTALSGSNRRFMGLVTSLATP